MIIKGNFKLGGNSYQVEADGVDQEKEILAFHKVIALTHPREVCNLCKNDDSDEFDLESHQSQGYTFVSVICKKCGGRSQLGRYKSGGYYWREFQEYHPRGRSQDLGGKEEDIEVPDNI